MEDIFVVPDYKAYLEPYTLEISNCFKGENTQLQWTFEYVFGFCQGCVDSRPQCKTCSLFPCGVKVTYRAYSSDEIWEFKKKGDGVLNCEPYKLKVTVQPEAQPEHDIPEGMFILKALPGGRNYLLR